jgi:hypothetical protein
MGICIHGGRRHEPQTLWMIIKDHNAADGVTRVVNWDWSQDDCKDSLLP